MKCLKCFEEDGRKQSLNLPPVLKYVEKYHVCDKCDDKGKYAKEYYRNNKEHYKELHKGYREELIDSYVANMIADKSSLKAKDIPDELIDSKRQYIKLKRLLKEG